MKSTVIKYGLYACFVAAILFVIGLLLGESLSYGTRELIGYTSIVLSLTFVFFGIKHFRDNENGGSVSFGKALGIGVLISILAGLGVAVVDAIYTTFVNPDFFAEYTQMLKDQGRGDEIMEIGSGMMAVVMFMTVFVIGFIISLLSAVILQRKN